MDFDNVYIKGNTLLTIDVQSINISDKKNVKHSQNSTNKNNKNDFMSPFFLKLFSIQISWTIFFTSIKFDPCYFLSVSTTLTADVNHCKLT